MGVGVGIRGEDGTEMNDGFNIFCKERRDTEMSLLPGSDTPDRCHYRPLSLSPPPQQIQTASTRYLVEATAICCRKKTSEQTKNQKDVCLCMAGRNREQMMFSATFSQPSHTSNCVPLTERQLAQGDSCGQETGLEAASGKLSFRAMADP